jgi:hypothetical protein
LFRHAGEVPNGASAEAKQDKDEQSECFSHGKRIETEDETEMKRSSTGDKRAGSCGTS